MTSGFGKAAAIQGGGCCYCAPVIVPQDGAKFRGLTNVGYQSSGQPLRWPFKVKGKVIETVPSSTITTDVSDALVAMLAAGAGIGMGATFVTVPYVARGELLPVLADFAVEQDSITALWPESRRTNPAVRAALDRLAEVFARRG